MAGTIPSLLLERLGATLGAPVPHLFGNRCTTVDSQDEQLTLQGDCSQGRLCQVHISENGAVSALGTKALSREQACEASV